MAVARNIQRYEHKGFTAWLSKITLRTGLNYIRHQGRKSPLHKAKTVDSELVLSQLDSRESPLEDLLSLEK